ncbi:MAG: GTP cyclohydrolase I FolE [Acidobacteria bacterium]|nr:GTP cyclohydrolase I FolE [Acidobacteriota bacterium]
MAKVTDGKRAEEIARHVASLLELAGFSAEQDPELAQTPERVSELLLDLMRGPERYEPPTVTVLDGSSAAGDMILIRGVEFHSLCVHHLLPFFGLAHIGYVSDGRILGLSSVARLVNHFAGRPQLQERFARQLCTHLVELLQPRGVIVLVEARQLCMEMRGARRKAQVDTITAHGCFEEASWRLEFLQRLTRKDE